MDFVNDPRWVNRYWMVASPVGFGLSIWLGRRAHRLAGQLDRQASARWILHWLGYVAAGMLGNVLVISGQLQPAARGPLWVLLLALTYFQAGVHADRRLLPIGLLLAGVLPDHGVPAGVRLDRGRRAGSVGSRGARTPWSP